VVGAVWWRLVKAGPGQLTARLVAAVAVTALPVVATAFLAAGPLQPGWAQRAAATTILIGGAR
jgi:sulfoxide reductase heme-binding subunit YedZ